MISIEAVRPDAPDVAALIGRHFALMRAQSPEESCHVLTATALADRDVHMFALREDGRAVSIGALSVAGHFGEVKSMHTTEEARGRGHARALLRALIEHARRIGVRRVALETGSGDAHAAARALYASEGFSECPPFGSYQPDPLSQFMDRAL